MEECSGLESLRYMGKLESLLHRASKLESLRYGGSAERD